MWDVTTDWMPSRDENPAICYVAKLLKDLQNERVPPISWNCFVFENIVIMYTTMLLALACNGFVNVILK